MKEAKVPYSPHKKGLSLSLSKKNGRSDSTLNTPKTISNRQAANCQRDQLSLSVQRPSYLFTSKTVVNMKAPRPPVIIYRYQKSQWQKLQEANKLKRHEVDRMKRQLQNLNKQLGLKKIMFPQQPIQAKSVPCSPVNINFTHQIANFQQNLNPMSSNLFIKTPVEKKQQIYRINVTQQKLDLKQQVQVSQIAKKSDENANPIPRNSYYAPDQKKHNIRQKKSNIDVDSLLQIQNRLNRLIDFTNF